MNEKLQKTIDQINKEYGIGSIMNLTDEVANIEGISTGSPSLDKALGGKGVPKGRIIEIFGPESSGKTTLSLHIIAEAQKLGGICAFVDAEHALDPAWAKKIGVNMGSLLLSQPDSAEQALSIVGSLVSTGEISAIVVDSVASLVPEVELEGDMGQTHIGLQARLMSQALRKLTGAVHNSKTVLVFINQIRYKIGVMYGNPETTPGGNALKFHSSVRLDIRKITTLKNPSGEAFANRVRVKIVKNKIAPPFKIAEFDLYFDSGINKFSDILDIAVEKGIVEQKGAWFRYGKITLGQGKPNTVKELQKRPELYREIEKQI